MRSGCKHLLISTSVVGVNEHLDDVILALVGKNRGSITMALNLAYIEPYYEGE
jgi:hypothetical protein